MLITHDQVAGLDHQAAYLNGNAHLHQMYVGMGNSYATGEEMESRFPHLIHVPYRSIGNGADTPQGLVYISVHLAPEGAHNRGVYVVDHRHSRFRDLQYLRPPLRGLNPTALRRVGAYDGGDRVSNHGFQFGKDALDLREHKSFVTGTNVEELDGIGYGGRRPTA